MTGTGKSKCIQQKHQNYTPESFPIAGEKKIEQKVAKKGRQKGNDTKQKEKRQQ